MTINFTRFALDLNRDLFAARQLRRHPTITNLMTQTPLSPNQNRQLPLQQPFAKGDADANGSASGN
jgi:N-formylglutamate amidohydrolase